MMLRERGGVASCQQAWLECHADIQAFRGRDDDDVRPCLGLFPSSSECQAPVQDFGQEMERKSAAAKQSLAVA